MKKEHYINSVLSILTLDDDEALLIFLSFQYLKNIKIPQHDATILKIFSLTFFQIHLISYQIHIHLFCTILLFLMELYNFDIFMELVYLNELKNR